MKGYCCLIILLMMGSSVLYAQQRPDPAVPQGANMEVPEGWNVRLDHGDEEVIIGSKPDSSDIYFVNMTPGWHITTGPAGIFYHPENTASGNYRVYTALHLFDPAGRNREGYGIFLGGNNLEAESQSYVYFLLRNTGEYLIKSRSGAKTTVIEDWTSHEAINVIGEEAEESSVKNSLIVEVEGNRLIFYINEQEVSSMPKGEWSTDGLFGLRVNHSVNLHISDLAVVN